MDCLFCKIVNKEIPSFIICEDDDFLVILDRFPATCGHTLIISKKHSDDIFGLDENTASKLFPLAAEIAGKLKSAFDCDGLNVVQNNSPAAGQTVFHFHTHLIPRYKDDGVVIKLPSSDISAEELEKVLNKIKF